MGGICRSLHRDQAITVLSFPEAKPNSEGWVCLPRQGFCLEKLFASRGFFPRDDSGRERILAEQIQNFNLQVLGCQSSPLQGSKHGFGRKRELLQATGKD